MPSRGDQARMVKRPSCEATSATASVWSCANCAAEMWRVPPSWTGATTDGAHPSIGSRDDEPLDLRPPLGASDLHAEREQLVAVVDDGGAVDGGEAGHGVDHAAERLGRPLGRVRVLGQLRQLAERRLHRVRDGTHDRLAPGLVARGHHQQRAAALVRAHRDRRASGAPRWSRPRARAPPAPAARSEGARGGRRRRPSRGRRS